MPRPGNKYAWLVGILMLMGLGVLLFAQTLPNSGEGLEGPEQGLDAARLRGPVGARRPRGRRRTCARSAPCPDQAGGQPACELTSEEVVNLCELREKPLVLTVIFDRGADCYPAGRPHRARARATSRT